MKITSATITPLDPLDKRREVVATFEDGSIESLFWFFTSNVLFEPSEFVGLTKQEALSFVDIFARRLPPADQEREWSFHSLLDTGAKGCPTVMQVWSRMGAKCVSEREWTLTTHTPGHKHHPASGCGHWISTEAFKQAHQEALAARSRTTSLRNDYSDSPTAYTPLNLKLHARGTAHQLVVFLRNAADQITRDTARPLPWFRIQNGSDFSGDFKVITAEAASQQWMRTEIDSGDNPDFPVVTSNA